MSVELANKYSSQVDEKFASESKTALVTNDDYDFSGAHTVKIYKITTATLNDYDRAGTGENASRYGAIQNLSATTEEATLSQDKGFKFVIDKLDEDETATALSAESALMRQIREVVIPTRDKYIYGKMADGAGIKKTKAKTGFKWYENILEATMEMDEKEVPEAGRVLILSPAGYSKLKQELNQVAYNEIAEEDRKRGVVGYLDGMQVIKVPSTYLPENFAFMIAHPSATVAPVKLADYGIFTNSEDYSGTGVVGRFNYDAFVLDNKKNGIFLESYTTTNQEG